MDDFASETDSDYTSYWRDWVSPFQFFQYVIQIVLSVFYSLSLGYHALRIANYPRPTVSVYKRATRLA